MWCCYSQIFAFNWSYYQNRNIEEFDAESSDYKKKPSMEEDGKGWEMEISQSENFEERDYQAHGKKHQMMGISRNAKNRGIVISKNENIEKKNIGSR